MINDRLPLSGKDRQKLKEQTAEETRRHLAGFRGDGSLADMYSWIDSPLGFEPNELDEVDYDASFQELLRDETLSSYILKIFGHKRKEGGLVVADWGGPGRRLAQDIAHLGENTPEGALGIKKSFGATLKEVGDTSEDEKNHHTVAEVNLVDTESDDAFEAWRGSDTVDIFFSRMAKGLETIPLDPYLLGSKLQTAYTSLSDDGVILFQVPYRLKPLLKEWDKLLEKECAGTLEHTIILGQDDTRVPFTSVILIRKLSGAPAVLPMLDAKTVQKIAKKMSKKKKW